MALKIFQAGTIINPVKIKNNKSKLRSSFVRVAVPARLNTMCFDLRTLTKPDKEFVYNAGELAFSVNVDTIAGVRIKPNKLSEVKISSRTHRPAIAKHAAIIMQKTLGVSDSFSVEAISKHDYPHAGLGSSSSIITAVCVAINEAYGKPLSPRELVLLISQNHGEEIVGNDNELIHVQCNGGSPSVALYGGGAQFIVGESNVMLRENIPVNYTFVFGIPSMYKRYDAKKLMSIETDQFPKMMKSRNDYSREIAWKVLHELVPAVMNQDMDKIGDALEYYRFETGSLKIDSQTWHGLYELMKKVIKLRGKTNPIISVSSCGPAIYVLTSEPKKMKEKLVKMGMETFSAKPNNSGYRVLKAVN